MSIVRKRTTHVGYSVMNWSLHVKVHLPGRTELTTVFGLLPRLPGIGSDLLSIVSMAAAMRIRQRSGSGNVDLPSHILKDT